jgi:hypothetical protein
MVRLEGLGKLKQSMVLSGLALPTFLLVALRLNQTKQTPWPLVRKRTISTERPPLVGEI